MQLRNPFSLRVRVIFMDCWECFICKQNGTQTNGLELHHITGRQSSSALNCAPLCGLCHNHIGHSFEEEKKLLQKTVRFLLRNHYEFKSNDLAFYNKYKKFYD